MELSNIVYKIQCIIDAKFHRFFSVIFSISLWFLIQWKVFNIRFDSIFDLCAHSKMIFLASQINSKFYFPNEYICVLFQTTYEQPIFRISICREWMRALRIVVFTLISLFFASIDNHAFLSDMRITHHIGQQSLSRHFALTLWRITQTKFS